MSVTTTADPDDQGEAFIPRRTDYDRSRAILDQAAAWYDRPKGQTMTEQPDVPPFTLDGAPQFIPRERYVELIRALGLDPGNVKRVDFRTDGVYIEVMYRNERGNGQVDEYVDEVVHHRVYIPVK